MPIIFLVLGFSAQAYPESATPNFDGLEEFVIDAMAVMQTPGLALVVVEKDGIVYNQGFGTRTVGAKEPVDGNTIFNIGSMTKAFTSTAIGILIDQSDLEWDSRLSDELPWFRVADPYLTRELTVRDALAHRSGIADSGYWVPWTGMTRKEVVEVMRYIEPMFSVRTQFLYNNPFFVTAGEVIPQRTGKSWDEFVQERILQPLGMNETLTDHRNLSGLNIATPHVWTPGGMTPVPHYALHHVAAAGSILSNTNDMARWCSLQLKNGSVDDIQLIDSVTLHDIHSPQMIGGFDFLKQAGLGNQLQAYGLGWFVLDYRNGKDYLVAHGGSIDGMVSWMVFSPQNGYCIVALNNGGMDSDPVNHAIAGFIQDRYLGLEDAGWIDDVIKPVREEIEGERAAHRSHEGADSTVAPTLARSAYTGEFESTVFGKAIISGSDEGLEIQIGINQGPLEHWRGDIYRTHWSRLAEENGFVTFVTSPKGTVESLVFEPNSYSRQEYKRVPK
jgi:CubicO group peptidase (beta-lactamase class C family)